MSSSGDYEIGYGKPPKETRFKKGYCGGPGRAKGSISFARLFEKVLSEVGKDDRSRAEEMVRAACEHAVNGDVNFFRILIDRVDGPLEKVIRINPKDLSDEQLISLLAGGALEGSEEEEPPDSPGAA